MLKWAGGENLESYLAPVLVKGFRCHLVFGPYDLKSPLAHDAIYDSSYCPISKRLGHKVCPGVLSLFEAI